MTHNKRLASAIAAILGGNAAFPLTALAGVDSDTRSDAIAEITVTAQRRSENSQDVPIQIQALTADTLSQLTVSTFDDVLKYLPNVSITTNGPAQGNLAMRGLSVGDVGQQGAGGIGSFPNVATYLDEQSGQMPGRNLDIYAADMERIEVLEGPQGTLFGAGAQAGVLRYITNKPKLDVTEGSVNAGYAITAHGDPSTNADAMINIPLITQTLAARLVIYNDTRGGYINNVPGTFRRLDTDAGIAYAGGSVPANSLVINNSNQVGNAINPTSYKGIRAELLYKINDDWNALVTQSYQQMEADGVFYETPESSAGEKLPDLSVQLYNPTYDKDRFENTSLTVNGRIGDLKLVYAGSYLVRNVEQVGDYTNYARGVYTDYYQCLQATATTAAQCFSPSATWRDTDKSTHNSQEIRLSTPDDWRTRGIFGLFWEDFKIHDVTNWLYKTVPACTTSVTTNCLTDVGPPGEAPATSPGGFNDNLSFFDDITRGYTQKAVFGSVDFDLLPKVLTLTAGTRYYDINTTAVGSSVSSFGCFEDGPPPCTGNAAFSSNLTAENLNKSYKGFKSRVNLTYKPVNDVLLYYTWSQGFRPGGFNRSSRTISKPDYTYQTPSSYAPDVLINNEIGWKTQWFGRRVQFNGAVYQENWNDVQVVIFEPCCFSNLTFVANGPNYRVRGAETQIIARVTSELTLFANAAWNSSQLTNSPNLIAVNGAAVPITSPFGQPGSPLAQSPPFQASVRARYEIPLSNNYLAYVQVDATHQAHSYSATGNVQIYVEAPYSTYDASLGISADRWTAELYGKNLTDTRANLFENGNEFINAITVNRPRTLGIKFGYRF